MAQVKDIVDGIKHRLPDRANIYPALNRAVMMISKRLFYHKSTLVQGSLSVSVDASSSSVSMPSDFFGLMESPYINGKTYALLPVPDQTTKLNYTSDSTPIYYEMRGPTMYFYPGTSSAITINGGYWKKPTALTPPSDEIPFNGLFDDAIQEALIQVYTSDGNGSRVGALQNLISNAVDAVIPYLDLQAPKQFNDNLGLDFYANEEW